MARRFYDDAVTKGHETAGNRRHTFAGNDDSGEIERIGSGHCCGFAGWVLIAGGSQRLNSPRQRELLAEEAAYESAATNFASIFETTKGQQNFAPAREDGFAR